MLEFGDIVTLENNIEYVVASTCIYEEQFYVYLVNVKNCGDCILGVVKDDDLETIQDQNIFTKVMPLILDNADMRIFEEGKDNE